MSTRALGKIGEDFAAIYLRKLRYRFIDRNYRTPYGEIDLVFEDRGTLVIVEVKARWGRKYGSPAEAVTPRKLASIARATAILKQRRKLPDRLRIDVIAIELNEDDTLRSLRHIQNVTG